MGSESDTAVERAIGALADALDEYRSSKKDDETSEDEEDTPREKQPRDLREAEIRVRAHFRRSRKAAVAAEKQATS